MVYWTRCDWCGANLVGEDYARMPVTIHRDRPSKVERRWAEERRLTRHFCVEPATDYNRMGLDGAHHDDGDCCYTRAIAAIDGAGKKGELPGPGLEWRLMLVEKRDAAPVRQCEEPEPAATCPADEFGRRERNWKKKSRPEREVRVLECLGDDRLTIRELADRVRESEVDCNVYEGHIRPLVRGMLEAGKLERIGERRARGDHNGAIRYRYSVKAEAQIPATKGEEAS